LVAGNPALIESLAKTLFHGMVRVGTGGGDVIGKKGFAVVQKDHLGAEGTHIDTCKIAHAPDPVMVCLPQ
jgi:hypothetical protein